jgi:hypothetical protein
MTDQEFVDAALIAIAAQLSSVQQPCINEYDASRGRTKLLPVDEVASRAACIVAALVKERATMIAVDTSLGHIDS